MCLCRAGAISEYELSSTLLTAVRQLTYAQADAVLQQQDQAVPPAQTDGRLEDGGVSGHAKVGGGGGETASAQRAPAEREEVGSLLERMQALAELRRTLRIKEGVTFSRSQRRMHSCSVRKPNVLHICHS